MMSLSTLLLVLTPLLPAVMATAALVPAFERIILRTGWIAPLPALAAVAFVPDGTGVVLHDFLFGTGLVMTTIGRAVLGFTALLWLLAAMNAGAYLSHSSPRRRFAGLFLLVMAGNFGLLISRDFASFYLFFAMMSLASYVLVVHEQSDKALYAGTVYIVLAVIGETALLVAMMLAAVAADGIAIADARLALNPPGPNAIAIVLFAVAFGIKMGLFPLHVWLPLAHPAAPAPASAVLSGAMIKAGLFGMIAFLPIGLDPWPVGGMVLIVIGLFTAFYGVICGVAQDDAKAVLAYSSLSQMGVLAAALGVGWTAPAAWPALLIALTAYMVHHGLTKGGLFLLVGARQKGAMTPASRVVFIVLAGIGALALAGLPLSSGAVAKLALKSGIEGASSDMADRIVTILSLSAVATTLLVMRFLYVFAPWRPATADGSASRSAGRVLTGTAAVSILAGQVAIWWIAPRSAIADTLSTYGLWQNGWPLAVGLGVAAAAMLAVSIRKWPTLRIPQGDVLALVSPAAVALVRACANLARRVAGDVGAAVAVGRGRIAAVWDESGRRRSGGEDAVNRAVGQRAVTAVSIVVVAVVLFAVLFS